jgi:hypothetical protein
MNLLRRKCTAIEASVLLVLFTATAASAASVGTVTDLDGNLLVSRANGSVKVLAAGSAIEEGDILTSRKQTYATLTLADHSSVTLGPDTDLKVQRFVFDETPSNDGALFALAKGSVGITAGVLGTRSGDAFELTTPSATIDMRGASVVVNYVAPTDRASVAWRETEPHDDRLLNMVAVNYSPAADAGFVRTVSPSNTLRLAQLATPKAPGTAGLAPGLYVQVIDGLIHVSNPAGTQSFAAGQFGFTPTVRAPPIVVPNNPGMMFTPPPSFSTSSQFQTTSSGSKPKTVDCEVR